MAVNSCKAFDEVTAWNSMSNKDNINTDFLKLSMEDSIKTKTAGSGVLINSQAELNICRHSPHNTNNDSSFKVYNDDSNINCNNNNSSLSSPVDNSLDAPHTRSNSSCSNNTEFLLSSSSSTNLSAGLKITNVAGEQTAHCVYSKSEINMENHSKASQGTISMTGGKLDTSLSNGVPQIYGINNSNLPSDTTLPVSTTTETLSTTLLNSKDQTKNAKLNSCLDLVSTNGPKSNNVEDNYEHGNIKPEKAPVAVAIENEDGRQTNHSNNDAKTNDPEWIEDRFRVDRRKLEQMLQGKNLYF